MSTIIRLIILSLCAYFIFDILAQNNFEFSEIRGRALGVPILFVMIVLAQWYRDVKAKKTDVS